MVLFENVQVFNEEQERLLLQISFILVSFITSVFSTMQTMIYQSLHPWCEYLKIVTQFMSIYIKIKIHIYI